MLADCTESVRVLDADLLPGLFPPELSASESMRSVLCLCKLCLVRGKLRSDTDCRLVRSRFRGRVFSA